jgi:hypothetical protein
MRKAAAILASVVAGIIVFGLINGIAEAFQLYWAVLPLVALPLSIYTGYRSYVFFAEKLDVAAEVKAARALPGSQYRYALYTLFTLQLVLSMGWANEFSDFVFGFILLVLFFAAEIFLIPRVAPKKGATIFIAVLMLLAALNLHSFMTDPEIVSNKYPEDEYLQTYSIVVWMLVGGLVLEVIKMATLHFGLLKKTLRR